MNKKNFHWFIALSLVIWLTMSSLGFSQVTQPSYGQTTVHVVQPGDTLYRIAQKYGTTVDQLLVLNDIKDRNLIYPGQQIILSETASKPPVSYTVQPGDTLYRIAIRFNTTVNRLVALNNISNPSYIIVGQVLIISEEGEEPGEKPIQPPITSNYIVQPGDTLYRIAIRFNTTVQHLVELNQITNPNILAVGQVILVPGVYTPPAQKLVYRGNPNLKQVALTFDAGAGATYSPQLLRILKENDVPTTMFLTGRWIENFPALAQQIVAEGYEIANHSYSHPNMTQISDAKVREEVLKTEQLIMGLGAPKPNLFRPPYGARNSHMDNIIYQMGYSSIMWSLDTIDWNNPGAQNILEKIKNNVRNGDIVLMHLNAPDTVEALPEMITWLRGQGYQLVTVSQIMKY